MYCLIAASVSGLVQSSLTNAQNLLKQEREEMLNGGNRSGAVVVGGALEDE